MSINATLLIQIIAFALFIWLINKVLWAPLSKMMADRQKRIADGLSAAEKGKKELDLAEKRSKEILVDAKEQAQGILAQAEKRANQIVDEAKAHAADEAERIRNAAQADVDQMVAKARLELQSQVAELVIAGAEKIIQKEIDAQAHKAYLDGLVAKL